MAAFDRDERDQEFLIQCPHCGRDWPDGPVMQERRGLVLIACPSCARFLAAVFAR
jgi:uncharacterized C2H2 Zn-finger protein